MKIVIQETAPRRMDQLRAAMIEAIGQDRDFHASEPELMALWEAPARDVTDYHLGRIAAWALPRMPSTGSSSNSR